MKKIVSCLALVIVGVGNATATVNGDSFSVALTCAAVNIHISAGLEGKPEFAYERVLMRKKAAFWMGVMKQVSGVTDADMMEFIEEKGLFLKRQDNDFIVDTAEACQRAEDTLQEDNVE